MPGFGFSCEHTFMIKPDIEGQLAQLVEQRIENPRVLGSIPRLATRFYNGSQRCGPFSFGGTVTET